MHISVIIPVYNAKQYLRKAVDSALQFTLVKEVILVEDGCPNGSLSVCKEILKMDNRVKLYQHSNGANKGAGASRNLGIEKATQEYIAFLDADDFYLANRFEEDVKVFKQNAEIDGVYNAIGNYFYSKKAKEQFKAIFKVNNPDKFLTTVRRTANPTPENCFYGLLAMIPKYGYFSLDGLTVKRKSLNKMNQLLRISSMHEDTDFCIRMAYYLKLFPAQIDVATALRGVHEENRITSSENGFSSRLLMYQNLLNWSENNIEDNKVINKLKLDVLTYQFLNENKKYSIFKVLILIFNHAGLFYNDKYFNLLINNARESNKIKNLLIRLKEKFVLLFLNKKVNLYSIYVKE